jgi:biopolymer transport protein ExbB
MDRWLNLRSERIVPDGIDDAIGLIVAGDLQAASSAAQNLDAPAGRILAAGIRRKGYGIEDVERAMEDQGGKEVEKLRSNIRPLQLIASIAPLLGLLGTVIGIQDAFALIVKAGMGNPEHLAGGIEEALVTTIAGLTVAIPALLIASYFNTKVRRLMIETDEKLTPAVELLVPHAS